MADLKKLGTLKNGTPVLVKPDTHVHPEVMAVIEEALAMVDETTLPAFSRQAVDMGRIVGTHACVETTPNDDGDIVWARRVGRETYSRFIRNRTAQPTRFVSVTLAKPDNVWLAYTSYFGTPAPKEPTDPKISEAEIAESRAFWSSHALILGETGPIDETTISTDAKW